MSTLEAIIQLHRDTAANWASVNPILADGELGVEIPGGKLKVGDGVTHWNSLPYVSGGPGSTGVQSVTAGDGTIIVGGTATDPTVRVSTGQFDAAGAAAAVQVALTTEVARAEAAEALKAPLASPTLTGTPTAPTPSALDGSTRLATTAYVDAAVAAAASGLTVHDASDLATTAPLPANTYASGVLTASANGALSVDGVAASVGNRVLVKGEIAQANNGIYAVTARGDASHPWVLTRATDMDAGMEVPNAFTFVTGGNTLADSGWTANGAGPYTLGTTPIVWTQFSSAGQVVAGTGLTKTGNTLAVDYGIQAGTAAEGDDSRITGALQASNNLSDVGDAPSSRANLGLGTAATQDSTAFDAAGAATAAVATETTRAEAAEALLAPKASPALTGTPTAPTQSALDNSTRIATTAYTDGAVAAESSRAQTAENARATLASPAFTGAPTAPTPAQDDSTTRIATTAWVEGQVSAVSPAADGVASPGVSPRFARADHVHPLTGPLSPAAVVNAAGALTPGKLTPVDASAGPLPMTLPTGQPAGTQVGVYKSDSSANAVTITGSIRGVAGSSALSQRFQTDVFVADASGSWTPSGDIKPSAYFDANYANLTGATFLGAVAMSAHKITGLANGTAATDAAAFGQIPVIDATATDIQPLGTQAAGATGKTADAGHVHAMPRLDQIAAPTADVSLNSHKLTNVTDPAAAQDAATKAYVDAHSGSGASTAWSGPGGADGANTGSAATVLNPIANNFGVWHGVMNAATPTITLTTPSAKCQYMLRLDQDATGGRVPSFVPQSGSIVYPEGTWDFSGAAAAANFASFAVVVFDGTNFFIFPDTTGKVFMTNPMTAVNDLIIGGAGGAAARLATVASKVLGTNGSGVIAWQAPGMTNPMTAVNDLIVGGAGGASTRLATVASKVLGTDASGNIGWQTAGGGSSFYAGLFGDGTDGALTFDGTTAVTINGATVTPSGNTYTLTADINATSITINSGVTVVTAGWIIKCQGALTNAGTISWAGNNASGATAGAGLTSQHIQGGGGGHAGGSGAGLTGTQTGMGGSGGAGGNGNNGSNAGGGTLQPSVNATNIAQVFKAPAAASTGVYAYSGSVRNLAGGVGGSSGGGDGTNSGGGGGSAGGTVVIFTHTFTSTGTINVSGGNGGTPTVVAANNGCGGGGGGGGGDIFVYTLSAWTQGTTTVAGGSGGTALTNGTGTAANGSAGGSGQALNIVLA